MCTKWIIYIEGPCKIIITVLLQYACIKHNNKNEKEWKEGVEEKISEKYHYEECTTGSVSCDYYILCLLTWKPKVSLKWGFLVFFFGFDWSVRLSSGNKATRTKELQDEPAVRDSGRLRAFIRATISLSDAVSYSNPNQTRPTWFSGYSVPSSSSNSAFVLYNSGFKPPRLKHPR